jgi:hypothetical protein
MSTLIETSYQTGKTYVPATAVAKSVEFDEDMMHVELADGRIISVPIIWFPTLRNASAIQRKNYEIGRSGIGIHWPDLDEDLSVAGLLAGVDLSAA